SVTDAGRKLGDIVLDVSVQHEQILKPVVAEVDKGRAEAEQRQARRADSGAGGRIAVDAGANLVVERGLLPGEVRDDQAARSPVVKVGDVYAHSGVGVAQLVVGDAALDADVAESAAAEVVEQKRRH